ncbi:hypothetical protein KFE98_07210 [bacterium SCSIO 12741]|nr:hypothetical protein KFE98_07210 [bacterium SCSIO 12741]
MPVKSYLAIPAAGGKDKLLQELNNMKECDASPADNKDVVVLLTETENETEEKALQQKLEEMDSIKLLTLVSAFSE